MQFFFLLTILRLCSKEESALRNNGKGRRVHIRRKDLVTLRHREMGGLLAAGVVHDLLNLATVIGMNAELIIERGDAQSRAFAENIHDLAKRESAMLDSILDFARGERAELLPCPVDVLIADFSRIMESMLTRHNIVLAVRVEDGLVVSVREGAILHVLCNLAFNAREAMISEGGEVAITAECVTTGGGNGTSTLTPGRYARITFRDTGHGMDTATLRRVFKPFFTTKRRTTGKRKGTGLGCAVSRIIIREHKGEMTVASEPGRGTTFFLYLPLIEERKNTQKRTSIHATASF